MTILKVVNTPKQCFGFAMTDDGDDVFLPSNLIRRHNLTELDEGAGFTALVRNAPADVLNQLGDKPSAKYVVIPPLQFDDQNPIFVKSILSEEDETTMDDMEKEITELLDRHEMLTSKTESVDIEIAALDEIDAELATLSDNAALVTTAVTDLSNGLADLLESFKQMEAKMTIFATKLQSAGQVLSAISADTKDLKKKIGMRREAMSQLHNEITAESEWRDETYPDTDEPDLKDSNAA